MPGRIHLLEQSPLGHREQDLDVVRGLAILLAMGYHLNGEPAGIAALDVLRWPGTTFGWAGVDLFFVLSGFLVGRLIFQEIKNTGQFDRTRFLIRRIFKLWPVLYVFLVTQLLFGDNPWHTYLPQTLLHVQNYLDGSHSHLWSLAVEEHFYLAAALLLPFVARHRWPPRRILCWLLAIVIADLLVRVYGYLAGESYSELQWYTHFRVDGLTLGIAIAALQVHYEAAFDRMVAMKSLWVAITAAGVVWLSLVPYKSALGSTIGYTVTAISGAAVMLGVYRAKLAATLRKPLAAIAFLGAFSYSMYIWHIAAARLYEKGVASIGWELPEWADIGMSYVSAIAASIIMVRLVEWPALRLRNLLFPTQSGMPRAERANLATVRTDDA